MVKPCMKSVDKDTFEDLSTGTIYVQRMCGIRMTAFNLWDLLMISTLLCTKD